MTAISLRFQNNQYLRLPVLRIRLQHDEEEIESRRLLGINKYLRDIVRIDDATREEIIEELKIMAQRGQLPEDPVLFAERVYQIIENRYPPVARRLGLVEVIKKNITSLYRFYRLTDASQWGEHAPIRTSLTLPDRRAQDFIMQLDEMFFSTYVQNEPFKTELKNFLKNEILEKGFVATDEVLKRFGNAWADSKDIQVRRIIDTSITRVRTFAHIRQMAEVGIKELEIVEIMDRITCGFCREMDSRVVSVEVADRVVESALRMSPEAFQERYLTRLPSQHELMATDTESLVVDGRLPPFHPLCRGRVIAHFRKSLREIEQEKGPLSELESYPQADYSDYGKKIDFEHYDKGIKIKTTQEIICSMENVFGKKVYLTQQSLVEAIDNHPQDKTRPGAIAVALSVVSNPDRIYLDTYFDSSNKKRTDNDTKIYFRHIRGINYAVVTKRCGPEIIWTAGVRRKPALRWVLLWQR